MEQPNYHVQAPTPEAPATPFIPVSGEEMTGWDTHFSEENLNHYYKNMQALIKAPYEITSTVVEGILDLKKIEIAEKRALAETQREQDVAAIRADLAAKSLDGGVVTKPKIVKDPETGAPTVVDPGAEPEKKQLPGYGPLPDPSEQEPATAEPDDNSDNDGSLINEVPGWNIFTEPEPPTEKDLENSRASGRNLGETIVRTGFGYGTASTAITLSAMGGVPTVEYDAALAEEQKFQQWYRQYATEWGLNPNPDDPRHQYDYRAAMRAGAKPDKKGHWPSKFKMKGHENLIVDGVDTSTNLPVETTADSNISDALFNMVKTNEGLRLNAYKNEKKGGGQEKYYTIGVGHYLDGGEESRKLIGIVLPGVSYKDVQEGRVSLTKSQAERLMVLNIREKRKQTIKVLEGGKYKWEELPQNLRNHLIDATFRGSFIPHINDEGQQIGSPATIKLIKEGKFREAAREFINRDDYRKAKETGVNRGIIKRMDAVRDALIHAAEYFERQGA
jgi:GH24 family phage-related lysozyme (muramidase)